MWKKSIAQSLIGLAALVTGTHGIAAQEMAEAEVRKINTDTGKIMLKHGPIKSLDMPPMTMVFTVKNPALINDVKVGDKIMFNVVSENGNYVVTDIQKK
ncbi:MAG: copper-binding protein [Limnobacter sp.]|nr:copper-binding protein [Limnobacter sp.]